ncbi:MAG: VWA domain-containing protein [Halieaceae bacterium]|nr:VWA domain-containing protein [Halieaceae bacterium]
MLTLQWPYALLLVPLPWLVWRFWPAAAGEEAALRAPFFDSWQALEQQGSGGRSAGSLFGLIALCLLWLALLAALARPTWVGEPVSLPASGRDLLVAVDLSGSMQVEDMVVGQHTVSRIDAVKQVVGEFIDRRRGDRLGLILFGSNAYVQAPLTFDRNTVQRFLREAQLGFAGRETAIGDAIGLAVKRLRERPADSRVLILLTDGANNAGEVEPLDAARLAADNGVKIHTIGIGSDKMVMPGLFGSSFGSKVVNPSRDLDENTLREIAERTGGNYFRARDPAELINIYQLLDALEPVEQEAQSYRPQRSLFHLPLAAAFGLSLLLGAVRGMSR